MATTLLKPVRRELLATVQHGKHRGRGIIVEILPGDIIRFRIKATRQYVETSLHTAYTLAQLVTFQRMHEERKAEYIRKKKAGIRCKRPRPFKMFVNKVFIEAIKKSA